MIVVEARMTCRPGAEEEFAAAVGELITATRTEPDFQAYACARDLLDPSIFVFTEQWADVAALGRHMATDHYLAFAAPAKEWVVGRQVLIHEVSSTTER